MRRNTDIEALQQRTTIRFTIAGHLGATQHKRHHQPERSKLKRSIGIEIGQRPEQILSGDGVASQTGWIMRLRLRRPEKLKRGRSSDLEIEE